MNQIVEYKNNQKLFIPLQIWIYKNSSVPIPLISLQYLSKDPKLLEILKSYKYYKDDEECIFYEYHQKPKKINLFKM
jgi:hypothetical protein